MKHITVYKVAGRYGGWPANHGIWSWKNEILVGFSAGHHAGPDQGGYRFHAIHRTKPEEHLLARTLDGGETWSIENPGNSGPWVGPMVGRGNYPQEKEWRDFTNVDIAPIDFSRPDFCMTCRNKVVSGPEPSRFYFSMDRGHVWDGPFELPLFGAPGVAARTDYLVKSAKSCQLFLTAMKPDGREGRPFVCETDDGGKSWEFLSWICESEQYAIMPSAVDIGDGDLLCAVRKHGDRSDLHGRCWIDIHKSFDNGRSWGTGNTVVHDSGKGGNPGHLLRLKDGRIVLTWGYRRKPYSIKACVSEDEGHKWNHPLSLRTQMPAENNSHDLGYTRSVQRPDGKIVTVYYWCDDSDSERYVAATIWEM